MARELSAIATPTLPPNPMLNGVEPSQNMVMLSSVEDDALGEELQVIWELEPGVYVHERMELPQPTGQS